MCYFSSSHVRLQITSFTMSGLMLMTEPSSRERYGGVAGAVRMVGDCGLTMRQFPAAPVACPHGAGGVSRLSLRRRQSHHSRVCPTNPVCVAIAAPAWSALAAPIRWQRPSDQISRCQRGDRERWWGVTMILADKLRKRRRYSAIDLYRHQAGPDTTTGTLDNHSTAGP